MKQQLILLLLFLFTFTACQKSQSVSVTDLLKKAKSTESVQSDKYFVAITWKETGGTVLLEKMQEVFSVLQTVYGVPLDRSAFSPISYKGSGDGSDISSSGSMVIVWPSKSKNPEEILGVLESVGTEAKNTGQTSAAVAIDSRIND